MYSCEHTLYLNSIKKYKIKIILYRFLLVISFLCLWQVLAYLEVINTFIYSSPYDICITIVNLIFKNNLFYHIYITLLEVLISFALGTIIGFVIASILWANNTLSKVVEPFLTMLNSLPKVAIGPIIIIWFGANMKSIIVLALLISVFITIINLHQAFSETDENKIKLLKMFKASKLDIYTNLIIPSNYISIINCLKVNISMSLIGVIMGEFLVSKAGIGYLIMYGSNVFNLDLVISGVVILGFVSIILYYLVSYIEKKIVK